MPRRSSRRSDRGGVGVPGWLRAAVVVMSIAAVVMGLAVAYLAYDASRPTTGADLERRSLEATLRGNPDNAAARRRLAFVYQSRGDKRRAVSNYGKVLEQYPEDLASLYNVGAIRIDSWWPQRGVEDLRRVLALAPDHALAAITLGQHYVDREQYAEALSVLLPALEAHPELADIHLLVARAYEGSGAVDLAKEYYLSSLRLIPDSKDASDGLSRVGGAQ